MIKDQNAILLVNMGSPICENGMKAFLKNMFNDKAIINSSAIFRSIFSTIISELRYKSSWKKYQKIGGSPLYKSMNKIAHDLQYALGEKFIVSTAYSYTEPGIENKITELRNLGITNIKVISMYPQASFSTTGSINSTLNKISSLFNDLKIEFVGEYYDNECFIRFWVDLIQAKINENGFENPFLLFSSHGIPASYLKRGDNYSSSIEKSASLIANQLNLQYAVSYQSKIGPVKWTKPYTLNKLKELSEKQVENIIIVPVSFLNENLETLYDIDTELIPYAKNKLGINRISRINLPDSNENLIKLYLNILKTEL